VADWYLLSLSEIMIGVWLLLFATFRAFGNEARSIGSAQRHCSLHRVIQILLLAFSRMEPQGRASDAA
jgi:hypothetical protein